MFHLLVGLVPCHPVCRLLPTFVHLGFPYTSPVAPPAPIPLVWFPSTPSVAPPAPIPLGTTPGGCAALLTRLCFSLVSRHHEPSGFFKEPSVRYHVPAFFAAVDQSAVSTPNTKGECCVR